MNCQNCTFISKNKDCDEAMAITSSYPAHCGNSNPKPSKKGPDCWNCREHGHIHHDCKKPKKKPPTAQSESANQVTDDSDDEAFGVSDIESDAESMPKLESVCDSDEFDNTRNEALKDWFSDVASNWVTSCDAECMTDELSGVDSECSSFVNVDLESVVPAMNEIAAAVTNEHSENCTELYDSRTTRHISPYCEMFENYASTPPKSLNAANNRKFVAIGKGNMVIEVPNSMCASQLQLYKVVHDGPELTCVAEDMVTWTELHHQMGHVSQGVAKQLAEKGLVTRVHIDTASGDDVFCESCIYAQAMRKPIAKAHEGEQSMEFRGEIHTDLWGPEPVTTIKGRNYYISFTDDKM